MTVFEPAPQSQLQLFKIPHRRAEQGPFHLCGFRRPLVELQVRAEMLFGFSKVPQVALDTGSAKMGRETARPDAQIRLDMSLGLRKIVFVEGLSGGAPVVVAVGIQRSPEDAG